MKRKLKFQQVARRGVRSGRAIALALLTPLFEKNPCKAALFPHRRVTMVLSMARLIVLAFAAAMLRQILRAGIAGWPDATLCIAIVLAMPLLSALERVRPEDVVALFKSVTRRFGEGAVRSMASVYPTEPSKYDDHRDDASRPEAA